VNATLLHPPTAIRPEFTESAWLPVVSHPAYCAWCDKWYSRETGEPLRFQPERVAKSHSICGPCRGAFFQVPPTRGGSL
jgi:hypothetical protein